MMFVLMGLPYRKARQGGDSNATIGGQGDQVYQRGVGFGFFEPSSVLNDPENMEGNHLTC